MKVLKPLASRLQLDAPDVDDIVILMPSAVKQVSVPFKGSNNEKVAHRVIGGFGSFGNVITRNGVLKLLQSILPKRRQPIDLAFQNRCL